MSLLKSKFDICMSGPDGRCLARSACCFQASAYEAIKMKQDWVKAIGKKLREDLGDCPTLPQELVDALGRLEKAEQACTIVGQTSVLEVGAKIKHGSGIWPFKGHDASGIESAAAPNWP